MGYAASSSSSINWVSCGGLANGMCPYASFQVLNVLNKTTMYENITGELEVTGNAEILGNLSVDSPTFFIDSDVNRVGIGTASPSEKLTVEGGNILLDNSQGLYFKDAASSTRVVLNVGGGDNVVLGNSNLDDLLFNVGTLGTAVTIKETTGNVGIGTTVPGKPLHINSSEAYYQILVERNSNSDSGLSFKNTVNQWTIGMDANGEQFTIADAAGFGIGGDRLSIDTSGNVGIGTTNPEHKLEVAGSMNISGDVNISGTLYGGSPLDIGSDVIMHKDLNVSGIVNASKYYGDGSSLTGISGGAGDGTGGWVNDSVQTYTGLDVNISDNIFFKNTYDTYITPDGGKSQICSGSYNFRTSVSTITDLAEYDNEIYLNIIEDDDPLCIIFDDCWDGFTSVFLHLPEGTSTGSSNPQSLASDNPSAKLFVIDLDTSENYVFTFEFNGTPANCSMNQTVYYSNATGFIRLDDKWGIYSTDTYSDFFVKNIDRQGFDMRIDGDTGITSFDNGIDIPKISMSQGSIGGAQTGGHFNISYSGGDAQKTAYIDISDLWDSIRPPELQIRLHAYQDVYEAKIHLTNDSTTFSTDILFYSNSTYNIGSATQAAKGIYAETFYDLTPAWNTERDGSAMSAIMAIKSKGEELNDSTLPPFARGTFWCNNDDCKEADSYLTETEQLNEISSKTGIPKEELSNYKKVETRKTNYLLTTLVEAQQEMGRELCNLGSYEWC